ncbi:MAG TPA: methyltransferase domain-containing protein [Novosphingobium sp.]
MTRLADPSDKGSLSYRLRSKRDRLLRAFLLDVAKDRPRGLRICDLGGGVAYWERVGLDWLASHDMTVVCVNHDPGELTRDAQRAGPIELVTGDACAMAGYADGSFDVVHSNSVIEHVGTWPRMADFAGEVRRLAPAYYVQTPYFWFPVDPHFYRLPGLHWLPPSLRLKLHRRFRLGWAPAQPSVDAAMRLVVSNAMLDRTQFRHLFPDAEHRFEFFAGLPKSMIAMRSSAS